MCDHLKESTNFICLKILRYILNRKRIGVM